MSENPLIDEAVQVRNDIRAVITHARNLDAAATSGPWRWDTYGQQNIHELVGTGGDEDFTYDQTVFEATHTGGCGCRTECILETDISATDREFIAQARTLLPALVDVAALIENQHMPDYSHLADNTPWCHVCQDQYPCLPIRTIHENLTKAVSNDGA